MSMNSEIIIMDSSIKTPEDRFAHSSTDEYETMIDSGNSKDDKESNSSIELMEIESEQEFPLMKTSPKSTITTIPNKETTNLNKGQRLITVVVPHSTSTSTIKPQIVPYGRKAITATNPITSNKNTVFSSVSTASTHNLMKDATQAKYLLGDQTISVPILKNAIPLTRVTANTKSGGETTNKKIIGQSAIIIGNDNIIGTSLSNMTLKKINTSNFVTISPLNIQQSGGRIVQAQILRAQTSQQAVVSANQTRKITSIAGTQIGTKTMTPTLTYSKIGPTLASLKVSQDVSLPTKLFEDESISPDSSIEQDENDLMLTEEIFTVNLIFNVDIRNFYDRFVCRVRHNLPSQ